jgi:hypothetical protein
MIGWVTRRVRRKARKLRKRAGKTATRTKKRLITGFDHGVTRADARWEKFFETTLGPRLTSWMETGAPRPVLLAKCLARLAQDHEDLPQLEAFVARCLERFGEEAVLPAVSRAERQLPPAPSRAQTRLVRATLRHLSPEAAEDFGEHHIDIVWRDLPARRMLARHQVRLGRLTRPLDLLDPTDDAAEALRRELEAECKVLREGIALSPVKAKAKAKASGAG